MMSFALTILSILNLSILRGQQLYDLRLVNNGSSVQGDCVYYGRVEIYVDGTWGTVCDDSVYGNPDNKVFEVICNQLGYTDFVQSCTYGRFGSGCQTYAPLAVNAVTPTWFDETVCNGTEANLNQCQHNPFGDENCSHQEDIGVVCANGPCRDCSGDGAEQAPVTNEENVEEDGSDSSDDSFDAGSVGENNVENYDLRLVNNGSSVLGDCVHYGRVEIYFNDTWGTVCGDIIHEVDNKVFDVICNQLGYTEFLSVCPSFLVGSGCDTRAVQEEDTSVTPIWLSRLYCNGTELESNLNECQHAPFGQNQCPHAADIGIVCANPPCSECSADAADPVDETTVVNVQEVGGSSSSSSDDSFDAAFVRENNVETETYSHHEQNQIDYGEQTESVVTFKLEDNVNIVIIIGLCFCLCTLNAYIFCFYSTISRSK